jgi:hypothetical protein
MTDLRKLRSHYPNWAAIPSLDDIFEEMVQAQTVQAINQS